MRNQSAFPADKRMQQGAWLFLLTLAIFFVSSILLYGIYAYLRRDETWAQQRLPSMFLTSTICLLAISGMVHWATRCVRRQLLRRTAWLMGGSAFAATAFLAMQTKSMAEMVMVAQDDASVSRGLFGMVVVLGILHALHVLGGVIALFVVAVRTAFGHYDHERHFGIDFSAQYWHFLDIVWLCMIATFWVTTGGFDLPF
ncbi:MAG: cytochrome c oxidase subunit 3 [Planctomycetota bacterium]